MLDKKRNGFEIVSLNEAELKPGIVANGVIQKEDALVKVIKSMRDGANGKKIKTKYAAVSLPEEKSFLQVIKMPKMKKDELKSAVRFQAENYIPLPLSEVYLDFQALPRQKSGQTNVVIAAMPKKIVDSYVSCLKKAGVVPVAFELESQATRRALAKDESAEGPMVLIDFGENNTDFIVFSGNAICFASSMPVSLRQLDQAVADGLNISFIDAEKLRKRQGLLFKQNSSQKTLQSAMPVLSELALQIKKYISFYKDHPAGGLQDYSLSARQLKKIYLCGAGADLKGLPEFLSHKLGLLAETLKPRNDFFARSKNSPYRENPFAFSTALGLAMREFYAND